MMNSTFDPEPIKYANPIEEVIKEAGIELRKAGEEYRGLCPFHRDTVPSFSVNPGKSLYHCFGCGASGDVIDFVRAYHDYTWGEAIEFLAKRAGMILPRLCGDTRPIMEWVFAQWRPGKMTKELCDQYAIPEAVILQYGLRDGAAVLQAALETRRWERRHLIDAGLVVSGREPFSRRVIFPVYGHSGSLRGFTGRGEKPKWYHSQFAKSEVLWGWHGFDRTMKEVILVEGPLDVLALPGRALAILGSCISAQQSKQLARFDKVYLALDGDTGGRRGTIASLKILLEHGHFVQIIPMPEGKDPHKLNGPVPEPIDWLEWLRGLYPSNLEGRVRYAKKVTELIANLDPVVRRVYEEAA